MESKPDGYLTLQLSRAVYTKIHTEFPKRMSLPNNLATEAIFMVFFFSKDSVLRKGVYRNCSSTTVTKELSSNYMINHAKGSSY